MEKSETMSTSEERVSYDEDSLNGFIIQGKFIPEELLLKIFLITDHKTLRNCQLVCKGWNILIQDYVWKKKAERTLGRSLPIDDSDPWMLYYLACDNKFYKNLVKNHSGKGGVNNHWTITEEGGDGWIVENPPVGMPDLPNDSVFEGEKYCFVTSYSKCEKYQIVNFLDSGIPKQMLDELQAPVMVSEWYGGRWDCPCKYACSIELLTEDDVILDAHYYEALLLNDSQDKWFKFQHVFFDYGKGLRKIKFTHAGQDRRFWKDYYGSKMAGACISLGIPSIEKIVWGTM